MNRRPLRCLLLLALLGLAGCAGSDDDLTLEPAPPPLPPLPEAATAPDLERIGALPPQKSPPGRCGLFLWARTDPPRLVIFGVGNGAKAVIDGRQVELTRTRAEGDPLFGQYPSQTFSAAGHHLNLTLDILQRPEIVDGATVPRGLIELRDATGWTLLLPVAGLVGCASRS